MARCPVAVPLICLAFILSLALLSSPAANAQSLTVGDDTSTPVEGVGHDYIHFLSETVNPANGSVNLKIQLPVPQGRGITLPFSYSYNSDAVYHLYAAPPWSPTWDAVSPQTVDGWRIGFPTLNATGGTLSNPPGCGYAQSFIFSDPSGVSIPFNVSAMDWLSSDNSPCGGGSVLSGSVDGYQIELIPSGPPGCSPPAECVYNDIPVTKVVDPHGSVFSFGLTALAPGALSPPLTSIEDRNGNVVTINQTTGAVTDSSGRAVYSPTSNGFTLSGQSYQVATTNSTAGYSVSSNQIDPPDPPDACNWPSKISGTVPGAVHSITLPNTQQYVFYYGDDNPNGYSNPYGLLSEVDYPTGAWVRYTWQMPAQFNLFVNYDGYNTNTEVDVPGICFFQYQMPVVATRSVGFSGSSQPVLTQSFAYTTTWGSTEWTAKTTTVTTTDNVRNQTFQTTYSYQPFTVDPANVYSAVYPYQVSLESSVQYYNPGGTSPIRTVTKTWTDQYEMASQTTTLQDVTPAISSVTTYTYHAMGLPSSVTEYDYGQTSPTRQTVTNYQSFGDTPIFTNSASILNRPCQKLVYSGSSGSGTLAPESDYYYDGGTTLCGTAGTHSVSTADSPVQHDSLYAYTVSPQPPRGNLTQMIEKCFPSTACNSANPTSTFAYDETGQVLSMADPCGNGTCGDITGTTHTTTYSYADSYTVLSGGSNISYTPSGNTNSYLTKITNPLGQIESFTYDYNNGQLTTSVDENSQSTTYVYNDLLARPTLVNYPDGGQTEDSYNDTPPSPTVTSCQLMNGTAGAACSATSPASGWKTSISTMDGMGRLVQTELVSDPDGATYTADSYDGRGKLYQVYNPTRCSPPTKNCNTETTWGYNTYSYDALGRTLQVAEPDGSSATTSYSGNQSTVTDEAGAQRTSQTDALGRLTYVSEAPNNSGYGFQTNYQYDALNDLTLVTQNGNNSSNARTRSFIYDSLARLTSAANPESGTIAYSYDLNSNVSSKVAPLPDVAAGSGSATTSYQHDALNRLTGKTYTPATLNMPNLQFGYDGTALTGCTTAPPMLTDGYPAGNRTAMCDGSGATSCSHDKLGRVISQKESPTGGGVSVTEGASYTYNRDGSLSTLTYPSGNVVTYTVGGAGRPLGVSDSSDNYVANGTTNHATYAPSGSLASMANGYTTTFTGIVTANIYNNRLQPAVLSAANPSQTIFSLSYNFNPGHDNGNVQQITNNTRTDATANVVFTYDPLNRISQANTTTTGQNCWGEVYAIDAWGNLTGISPPSGMSGCNYEGPSIPVGTNNQITGYCYDGAGNLLDTGTCLPLAHSYVYDAEGQLQSPPAAGSNGAPHTYFYDGGGNRVEKCDANPCTSVSVGTLYWRDAGSEVLDESSTTGSMQEEDVYFKGKRIARRDVGTGNVHYYFSNHLGSSGVITDSSGNVQEQTDYYPFGGISYTSGADENRYKFTGKERDAESGLDNFGARFFASTMGRFMTPDWAARPTAVPYAVFSDPQSLNLYNYVRNDPVSRADLDGHCSTTEYPVECSDNVTGVAAGWETPFDSDPLHQDYAFWAKAVTTGNGPAQNQTSCPWSACVTASMPSGPDLISMGPFLMTPATWRSMLRVFRHPVVQAYLYVILGSLGGEEGGAFEGIEDSVMATRPAWASTPGGFVNWLKNLEATGTKLSAADADAVVSEAKRLGVDVRLDPPHAGTNWNVPHLNVGGK